MSASTPDLLTPDEVAAVRAALAGAPAAPPPPACADALEAARAYALGDGLDLFDCTDLFEVAARLLIALLARPPWGERPRATALAVTLALLHVNGIVVEAPADDLLAAVDLAAREDADLVEVAWALRQRARAW
ncbi:MAG: hypothetical protein M9894_05650 [Planctomycetes bacterium]|nr:hypothetical protein [Planctomycetota bacterium]